MSATPQSQRITLSEDLTIYHALEQKNRLLETLGEAEEIELDLSQVAEIDTAGVQLLILLKREAQKAGKKATIVAHSQAVRSVIDFCNLAAYLGDPLVIPARESA